MKKLIKDTIVELIKDTIVAIMCMLFAGAVMLFIKFMFETL